MNRLQKMAWYNLIVVASVLMITAGVIVVLSWKFGWPRARAGLGFMGLFGLCGLSAVLFRRKKGEVDFDERDNLIQQRALLAAYTTFWLLWVLGSMAVWAIIGPKGSTSVNALPIFVLVGGILTTLIQSIAILVQYGWGTKEEKL